MEYFLGIDLGSSYTKISVVSDNNAIAVQKMIKTFSSDRNELSRLLNEVKEKYQPVQFCATGFGREHFVATLNGTPCIAKTEIICAAAGTNFLFPFERTILDIGGEDIKVIHADAKGNVIDFYMNTKCAAGTGTFITEVAEKAGLDLEKMSEMAAHSHSQKELNSFCTVFAKTEILNWLLEETSSEDIARGVYLSIANRVSKLKISPNIPLIFVGGVAKYHPYLKNILEEKIINIIYSPECPQFVPAYGAAMLAKKYCESQKLKNEKATSV